MQVHKLKIWPEFFYPAEAGIKCFEIRKNDRDFKILDEVILMEYSPKKQKFTGFEIRGRITYITEFMQLPGYVVFQWERIKEKE